MHNSLIISAEQMHSILASKKLVFEDGAIQYFHADGTTDYEVAGHKSPGTWYNEENLYCSTWPPSTHVDRYQLAWSSEQDINKSIKFTHSISGETFVGKFI